MRGFDCLLSINGNAVAAQINASVNRNTRASDVTNKIEMTWENYLSGTRYWTVQCNGAYVTDDAGLIALEEAYNTGADIDVVLDSGTLKYEGKAFITSFPIGAQYNKDVTYTIHLQGKGELTRV